MRRTSGFYVLLLIGIIMIGVGVYMGTTSRQITYQTVGSGVIAHYIADSKTGYLQLKGDDALYVVDQKNFTPQVQGIDTFRDGDSVSFVYSPTETQSVDVKSIYSHLQGTGAKIVEITLISDSGSKKDFNSQEYQANPNGHYQNNWPTGGGLAALGALLAIGSFFIPKSRPQQSGFSIGTPPGQGEGYQQQPGVPPYGGPQPPYGGDHQPGPYGGQSPPVQPGYPPPPQQGYPYNQPPGGGNPYNQPPGR